MTNVLKIISLRLKPVIRPIISTCIVILWPVIFTRREAAAQVCQSRGKGLIFVSQFGDLTNITEFLDTVIERPRRCEKCCDEADAIEAEQNNQDTKIIN